MTIGRLDTESDAYKKIRDELRDAEIALRDQRERVAELRRQLPQDTPIDNATLLTIDGDELREVKLSGFFDDPDKPLAVIHFMFGKKQVKPCPMCSLWADGYNGIVPHLVEHMNFGVLVAGDLEEFARYAASRGWDKLRLLATGDSDLKRKLGFETDDGGQIPGVSIFTRGADGSIAHFYSQSALFGNGEFRGMDLLTPVWHFLDLTPAGRGDWLPSGYYPS